MKNPTPTTVERKSERELIVTRIINGPPHLVFEAFRNPELFGRWWLPKSFGLTLLSCESDMRTGGTYRLMIRHGEGQPMPFFGRYLEVIPNERIAWTNDEAGDCGAVTTATFEEKGEQTLLVMTDLYPSKEACDGALASGEKDCVNETCDQLDEIIVALAARSR